MPQFNACSERNKNNITALLEEKGDMNVAQKGLVRLPAWYPSKESVPVELGYGGCRQNLERTIVFVMKYIYYTASL